ncbi:MAG: sugar-binding transcriptional regulator [Cellulosilyticaceae bacterium]
MENLLTVLDKIIPDGIEDFKIRYTLLQIISEQQPVGRRTLAERTTYSERVIRNTIELLGESQLVATGSVGVSITDRGRQILDDLYSCFQKLDEFPQLEHKLEQLLELRKAVVVKGDADLKDSSKWRLGKSAANVLCQILHNGDTVAVTGGTTIAKMVELMPTKHSHYPDVLVVPARGSIGEQMEFQASTMSVSLAKKLGARFEQLHIPDNLSESAIETIKKEPHIQNTLQKMAKSDMIVFGVGDATVMSERRQESEVTCTLLKSEQAVAEAFRYYFNKQGEVVYKGNNIGLDMEDVMQIPVKLAVAGGTSKAKAILAARKLLRGSYLVLDEAAAKELLHMVSIHR